MQPTPPTHRNRCVVSMTEALHWCRKPLEQIVPVVIALEGAIRTHPDVICLLLRELRKVGTQSREMQLRDLLVQLLKRSSCASTWFVKEQDITNEGCPVAQPKFRSRPLASTMTPCPSGKTKRSTCGLMLSTFMPSKPSRPAMSISLSKWPMLPTMALFFIFFMCSSVMILKLPVAEVKMSTSPTTDSSFTTW